MADREIARKQAEDMARQRHELELDRMRRQAELESQRRAAEAAARQKADRARQEREAVEARARGVTGSGFFVSNSGHIATNLHVIKDFPRLRVKLHDGRVFDARRVGEDVQRDLAIVQIDAFMPPLSLGKVGSLQKGDRVYAVGYPVPGIQGQESKITDGIVNSLSATATRSEWFQLSAQIQPGNSGGPVVNAAGEVVGVAVAQANAIKYLNDAGSLPQNVNYAIKAAHLVELMSRLGVGPARNANPKGGVLRVVDESTVMLIADDPDAAGGVSGDRGQQELLVDQAHPGWRVLVKTQDFGTWYRDQPADVQRLSSSHRASDAVLMLTLYKRDRGIR
jgi:S1-C subfamily serine protease